MPFRTQLLLVYTALCFLALNHATPMDIMNLAKQKLRLTSFSWSDCGPSSYPDHVKSLTVSPDPVRIPGNITVSTSFVIGSGSTTDVALAVTIEKKVAGVWIKLPCLDNLGSCNYTNVCKDWAEICPKYFEKYGLPCNCPFPAKTYTASDVVVDVTEKLPPGSKGDLRITATLLSASTGTFTCLQLLVTVATD